MWYFNSPFPDFENPTDNGAANRYDVIVKVEDQDTEMSLSAKILEKEHVLYPRALKKVLSNINQ